MSEWRSQLAKYFMVILDGERNIEIQRQIIGRIPELEPYSLFQRFDRDNKKFISLDDFRNFLRDNAVRYSEAVLSEIMKQFDSDKDNTLNFEEFLKLILTNTDFNLRSSVTQREPYPVGYKEYLVRDLEENVSKLLKMEMSLVDEMMIKSEGVKYLLGFKMREAFSFIDYLNDKFIDKDSLGLFLKRNGYLVSSSDVKQLMYRLDRDCDGKLVYEDFCAMFFPDKRYEPIRKFEDYQSERNYLFKKDTKRVTSIAQSLSPLSQSLDVRASLNSYTSPLRSKLDFSMSKQDFSRYSRNFNESNIKPINSLGSTFSYSMNRSQNQTSKKKINSTSVICDYFKKVISLETLAENIKESFALKAEVHISTIFNFFDVFKTGSINIFDFKDGLNNLNIYATLEDARLLFRRFDLSRDDKLSYNEFSEMICPKKSEYAKLLINKALLFNSEIPEQTLGFLSDVFRFLLDKENQIENLRKSLSNNRSLNASDVFDSLKGKIKNYVLREDIETVMLNNGVFVSSSDVDLIMDRFDKNRDARITLDEFLNEFLPKAGLY